MIVLEKKIMSQFGSCRKTEESLHQDHFFGSPKTGLKDHIWWWLIRGDTGYRKRWKKSFWPNKVVNRSVVLIWGGPNIRMLRYKGPAVLITDLEQLWCSG